MEKVTLFNDECFGTKVSMQVYFKEIGQLFFDGYDCGKTVKDVWGGFDYEYTYTIEPDEVNKFYQIFNLKDGDKHALLQAIKHQFSSSKAYTMFGDFMKEHDIQHSSFSWC
jgi:hypothetical protein